MSSKALFFLAIVIASLVLATVAAEDELELTNIKSPEIRNPARVSSGSPVHAPRPKPEAPKPDDPKPEHPKVEDKKNSGSYAEVHESNTHVETEQQHIENP